MDTPYARKTVMYLHLHVLYKHIHIHCTLCAEERPQWHSFTKPGRIGNRQCFGGESQTDPQKWWENIAGAMHRLRDECQINSKGNNYQSAPWPITNHIDWTHYGFVNCLDSCQLSGTRLPFLFLWCGSPRHAICPVNSCRSH